MPFSMFSLNVLFRRLASVNVESSDRMTRPLKVLKSPTLFSTTALIVEPSRASTSIPVPLPDTSLPMIPVGSPLIPSGSSALIGVFLAILELVRHHSVRTHQDESHGEIWILPGSRFSAELDLADVDEYALRAALDEDLPSQPR